MPCRGVSRLILYSYLCENGIQNRTDHEYSEWILAMLDAAEKLGRERTQLSQLEFQVVHRADVKNQPADALS